VRRQVHDIPEVATTVTEHRLHKRRCSCGCVTTAVAPAGVNAPVAYGPNLRALAVYLVVYQHVPVERAARLIANVCGAGCSTWEYVGQDGRSSAAIIAAATGVAIASRVNRRPSMPTATCSGSRRASLADRSGG
jgi:transposase